MEDSVHFAIDAVGATEGGAATIARNVLAAATAEARIARVTLFLSPRSSLRFDLPHHQKLCLEECPIAAGSRAARLGWLLKGVGLRAKRIGADSLLCLGGGGGAPDPIRVTTLMHQALPFWPQMSPRSGLSARLAMRLRLSALKATMRHSCQNADRVVVQTQVMQELLVERFGLDRRSIAIILTLPGGTSRSVITTSSSIAIQGGQMATARRGDRQRLDVFADYPPDRRLLYVGSASPHKNIGVLLGAVEAARRVLPDLGLFCTLAADHEYCRAEHVTGIGYLPAAELRAAYRCATALVMPSLLETVGLPLLEAFSELTPVIAADRPYAREVCGNAAIFFDAGSPEHLARRIVDLCRNSDQRSEFARRGRERLDVIEADNPYQQLIQAALGATSDGGAMRSENERVRYK